MSIGGRTVNELKRDMAWSEFQRWQDFEKLEPFGDNAADGRIRDLIATLVNLKLKKGKQPFKFTHFVNRAKQTITKRYKNPTDAAAAVRGFFAKRGKINT